MRRFLCPAGELCFRGEAASLGYNRGGGRAARRGRRRRPFAGRGTGALELAVPCFLVSGPILLKGGSHNWHAPKVGEGASDSCRPCCVEQGGGGGRAKVQPGAWDHVLRCGADPPGRCVLSSVAGSAVRTATLLRHAMPALTLPRGYFR